jgi:Ferritin-like
VNNDQDTLKGWNPDLVREHLQNAVHLELWTIPLYLAAAYSIKAPIDPTTGRPEILNLDDLPKQPDGSLDFEQFTADQATQYAFDSVLSVAIQEMLHLELAANILNAVRPSDDVSPKNPWVRFTGDQAPSYTSAPACLDAPLPDGVKLMLGAFRVEGDSPVQPDNQLRLFQWIEEERPPQGDPEAYQPQYDSIGNFYTALNYGLKVCWPDLYPADGRASDPLQKDDWGEGVTRAAAHRPQALPAALRRNVLRNLARTRPTAGASNADSQATAAALVEAGDYPFSIKVEGSAADALAAAHAAVLAIQAQGEGAGGGQQVPPQYRPTTGETIEIFLDSQSHYERFTQLVQLLDKVVIYEVSPPAPDAGSFEETLNFSYSSFLMSLDAAFASTAGVGLGAMKGLGNRALQVWESGGQPQFTWEDPSSYIDPQRTKGYHACQGLDPTGTNDCATAYFHACGTTNMCAGQGGCGLAGGDPEGEWRPGQNSGQGNGGCGVPIPATQVFNANPDPSQGGVAPPDLQNKNVWEYAREQLGFTDKLEPNAPRKALTPTSPVYPPSKKGDA